MAPQQRAITVVVADDEPHVVAYLQTVLHLEGFDVVGTAGDADGAVVEVTHLHPDVVLLDLDMPGDGLHAAELIGSLAPETRILIFSSDADGSSVLPLLQSGIQGYVVKGCAPERLTEAIHAAMEGQTYLAPSVNQVAVDALTSRLHAERQETLQRDRDRTRVADVIAQARFLSVLQPVFDLARGAPVAVEALTRFTTQPARTPHEWFAQADRVGLRVPLELAVASTALRDLRRLDAPLALAVNISPATVLSGRLGELLYGQPLDRVILELTEHSPVNDYRVLEAALAPWRERGARLAVDDAGAGYASFTHILRLHPELIKLDTDMTRDIHLDRPRQALARAVIGYATEMGVGVIAEGIEVEAELDMLIRLGAPFGQGFHLGRPRPLDEQLDLLGTAAALEVPGIDLRDGATADLQTDADRA
ncbi:MAG TPA: EAL domain-containing protein [Acidimicrobiales bacterium]|nr:EAL domain-containing protein [Acidimicrobiales bacterium]